MTGKGLKYRAENDPRVAALLALGEVLHSGADAQAALDRQLRSSNLVPSDKALCTELIYGVLRLHLRLSWFLREKLTRPDKLPLEMLLALELAAYEIAHLRIPAHASVNFCVGFLRNRFGKILAGVGNGVLRSFQRALAEEYENKEFYLTRLGAGEVDPKFLAVFYSMPEWIVQLWVAAYGEKEALSYLAAALGQAPSGIRVNLLRTGHKSLLNEFKQMRGVHFVAPAAFALPTGDAPGNVSGDVSGDASGDAFEARSARRSLPIKNLLAAGRISRQSVAAYEALSAMRPENWAQPVWDACAGRGGKSMALLEQGVSVARASDASEARLQGFSQEFQRLFPQEASSLPDTLGASGSLNSPGESTMPSCPEIIMSRAQLAALNDVRENTRKFGTILLDVPCSGLGTLARRPEIRWRRTPEDIRRLCAGQDELLDMADSVLKTGGSIVYLTCTLNPAENQERIEAFCKRHKDFKLEKEWQTPPDTTLGEFFWAVELRKG